MSTSSPRHSPIREYGWLVVAAALACSAVDAVLLQLRRDFFTGGFLAVDSADTWPERVLFAGLSFVCDAAVAGLLAYLGWALSARLKLGRLARWFLALACAVVPVGVADTIEYQLVHHLGDAFDFGLMFDLVGRSPAEILAVSSAHLVWPALGIVALVAAIALAAWGLHRLAPSHVLDRRGVPLVVPAFVLLAGGVVTVGARLASETMDNGLRRKPTGAVLGSLAEWATDVDRDGYGALARPPDPDAWDANVFPYGVDVPGNGVDEDGVGGDLPPGPAYAEPVRAGGPWVHRPDVVLVFLETFRADAVGRLVSGRAVTPTFDAIAAQGGAATAAYSHNGYTVQSRFHLFSGSLANLRGGTTLLDDFKDNGYDVAYFSAQDESFGAEQYRIGFERADVFYDARQDRDRRYTTFSTAGSLGVTADIVIGRVGEYLDRRPRERPLFLYVNFYDTHFPYWHRGMESLVNDLVLPQAAITPERADDVRAMYWNAAANVDAAVGRLLERVTRHLGREPAVVVLADHGESLFDEGFLGHGYALNDAQTRVPLVVRGLPLQMPVPVGQADLRDAIGRALREGSTGRAPRFEPRRDQGLFQYLGNIQRPRQIALISPSARVVYDFRSATARIDDRPPQSPSSLQAGDHGRFLELVHFWERLRLAQASAGAGR